MTNEQLDNLEKDLKILIDDNFHPRNQDLINMVFKEDIIELIKFTRKVNNAFFNIDYQWSGKYLNGYIDAINDLKREIYD